jgi:hypothetical protein
VDVPVKFSSLGAVEMFSWWSGRARRGRGRRRFVWADASTWASPILVCAMAGAVAWVPLGLQAAEGSDDGSSGSGPPQAVVSCLSRPSDEERASCFAAMGVQSARGGPPEVAACVSAPSDAERRSCFAAIGGRRGTIPERVARCLAQPEGRRRATCFAALRGRDRVIGARVERCLERPAGAQRASCLRRASR